MYSYIIISYVILCNHVYSEYYISFMTDIVIYCIYIYTIIYNYVVYTWMYFTIYNHICLNMYMAYSIWHMWYMVYVCVHIYIYTHTHTYTYTCGYLYLWCTLFFCSNGIHVQALSLRFAAAPKDFGGVPLGSWGCSMVNQGSWWIQSNVVLD